MLTFRYTGADGTMTEHEILTSGMVEKQVKLEFSSEWENMRKTAVFKSGTIMKDRVDVTDLTTIPPEVLVNVGAYLYVGIYGVSEDGTKITPTIYARGPKICEGTDPSGDESTDPTLPVWAQLQEQINDLKQNRGNDGADGLSTYYAPYALDTNWTAVFGKKISDVETAGRTLQVGDLLITSNAVLMRVTDVTGTQYSASKVAVLLEPADRIPESSTDAS